MFTGIVQSVGTVTSIEDGGATARLTISSAGLGDDLVHGEPEMVEQHFGDLEAGPVGRQRRTPGFRPRQGFAQDCERIGAFGGGPRGLRSTL